MRTRNERIALVTRVSVRVTALCGGRRRFADVGQDFGLREYGLQQNLAARRAYRNFHRDRACSATSLATRTKTPASVIGRYHLTALRLFQALGDGRVENVTLGLVEVVTLVIDHEIENSGFRELRFLIDDQATVRWCCVM